MGKVHTLVLLTSDLCLSPHTNRKTHTHKHKPNQSAHTTRPHNTTLDVQRHKQKHTHGEILYLPLSVTLLHYIFFAVTQNHPTFQHSHKQHSTLQYIERCEYVHIAPPPPPTKHHHPLQPPPPALSLSFSHSRSLIVDHTTPHTYCVALLVCACCWRAKGCENRMPYDAHTTHEKGGRVCDVGGKGTLWRGVCKENLAFTTISQPKVVVTFHVRCLFYIFTSKIVYILPNMYFMRLYTSSALGDVELRGCVTEETCEFSEQWTLPAFVVYYCPEGPETHSLCVRWALRVSACVL